LPYAFASDMQNKWVKKLESILSSSTIEKELADFGGREIIRIGNFMSVSDCSFSVVSANYSGAGGGR
jgi:hypothetical protein